MHEVVRVPEPRQMSVGAGTQLGPYTVLSSIGAGGMGEVYRARDTRLRRDVAIKVLPPSLAASEKARARLEREARAISQLSHPHICALYDVGQCGETAYLVMELLEGTTLADRLSRGPLPLEQLTRLGLEICSALEAAHQKGIVHRDLKPGNIMLTAAGVKLLDFGLAKAGATEKTGDPLSELPAEGHATRTETGTVVGTLQYMSPEQLEGRAVDARTDLFGLGTVLYEMATGRRAFSGPSHASLISAILTSEPPPVSSIVPLAPPTLDYLVKTCLAKEPSDRWRSAHDVGLQLRAIAEGVTAGRAVPTTRRRSLVAAAALLAAGAGATLALLLWRPGGHAPRVVRFPLDPPAGHAFRGGVESTDLAVSPDGSRIAFVAHPAEGSAGSSVFIRDLQRIESRRLEGTDAARSVFWAPDGRSVGFFTPTKLKRVNPDGGAPVTICELPLGPGRSGTWSSRGDILFAVFQERTLWRVPDSGGKPEVVLRANAEQREIRVWWPWFLPGGERFLYVVRRGDETKHLMLGELGKPSRVLMPVQTAVQYLDPGFLIYAEEGQLLARRFDAGSGTVSGQPIAIADHVSYFRATGYPAFAASRSGTIVYQSRDDVGRLTLFDAAGREIEGGPRGDYLDMWMGRDGQVLVDRLEHDVGAYDIWAFDVARAVETRITATPDTEVAALGLADGSIVYSIDRLGQPQLYRFKAGREEIMAPGEGAFQMPSDVSPDGSTVLYEERTAQGPFDLLALPLSPPGKPYPVLRGPYEKWSARFSPDGRFIAFISDESGRAEAYMIPYPGPGERTRVSTQGASEVRFSHDGTELFYLSPKQQVMAVPIRTTSPKISIGTAREVFTIRGRGWRKFERLADGRFLAIVPEIVAAEQPLMVIVDWSPDRASAE